MPSTRSSRIALVITIVALLALGGLMAYGVKRYRTEGKTAKRATMSLAAQRVLRHQIGQGQVSTRPASSSAPEAASRPSASLASAPAAHEQSPAPAAKPVVKKGYPVLKLLASRGRCWVEVRKVTSSGAVLFTGILESGDAKAFRGKTLWVRLGAPETIDAFVDNKLRKIPSGTLDVFVTRSGIASAT